MLIVWALVGALWTYRLFGGVHADTALPASKALCVVPMLRVFAAVFSVVFWYDMSHLTNTRGNLCFFMKQLFELCMYHTKYVGWIA